LETRFCRSITLCSWPDSEPKKIAFYLPKQKPGRGGGLRKTNTCSKSPFTGQIF
jgi:hypothetical protein